MYVGLSAIHRERNDLAAARRLLLRSEELGEHTALPQNRHRWRIAMARIREAEGDLGDALDLLDEADRVYQGDFSQRAPGSGTQAWTWIRQGAGRRPSPGPATRACPRTTTLTYLREFDT